MDARMRALTRRRGDRGAAAVEFALVVPILLMVFLGIVNYGFVLAQQVSLNNGARQAARFAVVDGPTCDAVVAEFKDGSQTIGMPEAQVPAPTVSGCSGDGAAKPCTGSSPGDNVVVTFTRTAPAVVPIFPFPDTFTTSGEATMRCEFS